MQSSNQESVPDLLSLADRVSAIEHRNLKVEADKAWEVSLTRKSLIAAITYLVTAAVFYSLGAESFLTSALIPTCGYLLSTLTLPAAKRLWSSSQNSCCD